ncbi:hypothetical protein [Candidatus Babela massiliensis]|uniref:Uncharacterized protein n=1 Tax=Candidatus Babela massiliensis TaxID=673862 RepID=V6DFP3_9BACT|nr:hypothetical protein [Candidatus Babela massiliensis]CDK30390.1 hypothetical protein BABL1_gene_1066 [Candidatus Babela massiliensis]
MIENSNSEKKIKKNKCSSDNHNNHDHNHNHEDGSHDHGVIQEFLHHFPYAIFSVALSMIILSLLDYNGQADNLERSCSGFHMLFHSFHFLHILFASTGTVLTYSRFAKNPTLIKTLLIGTISPMIFCILSDVLLPYLSGYALGVEMDLHICFYRELHNVLPFLLMGVLNGLVLKSHHSAALNVFSLGSHFTHILISSLASLFYMVSHGFHNWYPQMGYVFLFLVIAIVVPCTFSDVIIPMYFAYKEPNKK